MNAARITVYGCAMVQKMPHGFGRWGFGEDPASYAAGRPAYPDALYDRLATQCGLRPGCTILEIGPGSGLATSVLLSRRPVQLVAIEPDARFANHLADTMDDSALTIEPVSFEQAGLPTASFDLAVAATSFHWIDQRTGLAKVRDVLRPGGWVALWWTHFGVATDDPFQVATRHLFGETGEAPSRRAPFDLDRAARLRDLATAGLIDGRADAWQTTHDYDVAGLVALYSTFSYVQALPVADRARFLADLARIADSAFGGRVARTFTTSLYTAQRAP